MRWVNGYAHHHWKNVNCIRLKTITIKWSKASKKNVGASASRLITCERNYVHHFKDSLQHMEWSERALVVTGADGYQLPC